MIDVENMLFTEVKAAQPKKVKCGSQYTREQSEFPYMTLEVKDNTIYERFINSKQIENAADIMVEVNAYSNSLKGKKEEAKQIAIENLKKVGMGAYLNAKPAQLSGGQKQRVAIAGIIAMKPDIIVMDEPTAMLDPIGRREVIQTIENLNKVYGITIILITHNMDEAVKAQRVVVIDNGKAIIDDTTRNVFKNVELLKSIGLDVPQASLLAYELRKLMNAQRRYTSYADNCKKCQLHLRQGHTL